MASDINDLNVVTAAFLTVALEALSLTDAGPPGRAYVSPGEPAMDCCGQCTVWLQDIDQTNFTTGPGALAGEKAIKRGNLPQLVIFVQATRCSVNLAALIKALEEGKPPNTDDLQATAHMVEQDGWALRNHFAYSLRKGELSRVCMGAEMLGGVKLTPQGGCVGWTFSFRYPIEGGILGT
jgi:hypothetical protein